MEDKFTRSANSPSNANQSITKAWDWKKIHLPNKPIDGKKPIKENKNIIYRICANFPLSFVVKDP